MPSLKIDLIVDDQGNVTIKNATKNVEDLKSATDKLGSSTQTAFSALEKQALGAAAAWLSVEGAMRLAHAAMQSIDVGAKVLQAEEAFNHVTRAVGQDADQMLASLKRVTAGTVDSAELMQKSMKFMSGGMDPKNVVELGEIARLSARRMGVDVGEAYATIGDAVETMKTRSLRAYGLITKDQQTLIDACKAAGVEIDAFRIILDNWGNQADKLGPPLDNAAERVQRFKSEVKDALDEWKKFITELASRALPANRGGEETKVPGLGGIGGVSSLPGGAILALLSRRLESSAAAKAYEDLLNAPAYEAPMGDSYEADRRKALDAQKMVPILNAFDTWKTKIANMNPDLTELQKKLNTIEDEAAGWVAKGVPSAQVDRWTAKAKGYEEKAEGYRATKESGETDLKMMEERTKGLRTFESTYGEVMQGRVNDNQKALLQIKDQEESAMKVFYDSWVKGITDDAQFEDARTKAAERGAAQRADINARVGAEAAQNRARESLSHYQQRAALYLGTPAENISGQIKAYETEIASLQTLQEGEGLNPKKWEDLQRQIDEVTKSLTPLQVKLIETNGTLGQGIAGGLRQWAYQAQTAYGAGAEMVTSTANAMQRGLATFFDYSSKGWLNYKSLVTNLMHEIYMETMKAMLIRPLIGGPGGVDAAGNTVGPSGIMGAFSGGGMGSFRAGFSRLFGGGGTDPAAAGAAAWTESSSYVEPMLMGGISHSGGVIGEGGSYRSLPAHLWQNARRMHTGGLAGDETAAILQKGETVIPKGGGGVPNVNFVQNITNNNNSKVTTSKPAYDRAAKTFIVNTMIEDHVTDGDYRQARRTWGDNP